MLRACSLTAACFLFLNCFSQQAISSKEEMKFLYALCGHWKVEVEFRLSSEGPWEKSNGTSSIKRILNDHLLEEDFIGTSQNRKFQSKTWLAINNQTGKFQRSFADS